MDATCYLRGRYPWLKYANIIQAISSTNSTRRPEDFTVIDEPQPGRIRTMARHALDQNRARQCDIIFVVLVLELNIFSAELDENEILAQPFYFIPIRLIPCKVDRAWRSRGDDSSIERMVVPLAAHAARSGQTHDVNSSPTASHFGCIRCTIGEGVSRFSRTP